MTIRRALATNGPAHFLGVLLLVGVACCPPALCAQVLTLPAFQDPFRPDTSTTSVEVRGLVGGSAFGDSYDVGTTWAAGIRFGVTDDLAVAVIAAMFQPYKDPGTRATGYEGGAAADYLLYRGRHTISAHGGVSYAQAGDGKVVVVPVGAGLSLDILRPGRFITSIGSLGGTAVYLWGLPRIEILHRRLSGESGTETVLAASVGAGIANSGGLGIHVGWDRRGKPDDNDALPKVPAKTWGLLLRLRF